MGSAEEETFWGERGGEWGWGSDDGGCMWMFDEDALVYEVSIFHWWLQKLCLRKARKLDILLFPFCGLLMEYH